MNGHSDGEVALSLSTPNDLTGEALAQANRLHDIVHPSRPGGVFEPERNPGGCDKVFCCAILPEFTAVVEPAVRADERARLADLADELNATYVVPCRLGADCRHLSHVRGFGDLIREQA